MVAPIAFGRATESGKQRRAHHRIFSTGSYIDDTI
jgi:hypothetical protein